MSLSEVNSLPALVCSKGLKLILKSENLERQHATPVIVISRTIQTQCPSLTGKVTTKQSGRDRRDLMVHEI